MTHRIDITGLRLLARGGQADIYDYGDGRVLRVARRPQDFERIRYEYQVYASLADSGIAAPVVYELGEADGTPAIVMERIDGITLLDQVKKNPLSARAGARELAMLHLAVTRAVAPAAFTDVKAKAVFCINKSPFLNDEYRKTILGIIDTLPDGKNICHGDFHPGNIIRSGKKVSIIDWSAATRGDFHADIAHTYLLLRIVPRLPHVGRFLHFIQKSLGRAIAKTYLKTINHHRKLDMGYFSAWTLVNAAERTYHGLPAEQKSLIGFIDRYLHAFEKKKSHENLFSIL